MYDVSVKGEKNHAKAAVGIFFQGNSKELLSAWLIKNLQQGPFEQPGQYKGCRPAYAAPKDRGDNVGGCAAVTPQ